MNILNKKSTLIRYILLLFSVGGCLGLTSFDSKKNDTGILVIKLNLVFNGQPLVLRNKTYATAMGDSLSIDEFKFYISTLHILNSKNHEQFEPNSYHLINAEDTSSLTIRLTKITVGDYLRLGFNIGIDSMTNVSGALDGDLDPTKGMFWAWNTGYIAAKMTGHSPRCNTLHHAFEYHIGGYLRPYNSLRKIDLELQHLKIETGKTTTLELNTDLAEWFKTPYVIDLSKMNDVVLPNKNAMMMADNYSDMFSVSKTTPPF